jgi:PIN like domain
MSGSEPHAAHAQAAAASDSSDIDRLERVLDRSESLGSIRALRDALERRVVSSSEPIDISRTAFGLDTNIVLRMAKAESKTTDLRDYLETSHAGPLVLPGQVVQEFWNNTVAVIDTVSRSVKKKYDELAKELPKTEFAEDLHQRFGELLTEFESRYGYLYDAKTVDRFTEFWEMLEAKALVSYVPRGRFERLVQIRNSTKTPPGFKDAGDGDFFVWADFLLGLLQARRAGADFDSVVLITEDTKPDWSSGSVAHPILVAEVEALLGVPFETWTLDKFKLALGTP